MKTAITQALNLMLNKKHLNVTQVEIAKGLNKEYVATIAIEGIKSETNICNVIQTCLEEWLPQYTYTVCLVTYKPEHLKSYWAVEVRICRK